MNNNQAEQMNSEKNENKTFKLCVNCKNYTNENTEKVYCKKIEINTNNLESVLKYQEIGMARSLFGDCGRSAKFFENKQ